MNSSLPDGSIVLDATGQAWQLEKWASVASGVLVWERWWYGVGVKTPLDDEGMRALGPLRVVSRGRCAA